MKKTKEEKARQQLAALLGIEENPTESHDKSMEAEATLEYYENPRTFSHKDCKQCGRSFATRGSPVAYCSDKCRGKAFEEKMGVSWRPSRSIEERWGYLGEPLVVPPEALVVAQHVMAEQEAAKPEPEPEIDVLDLLAELGIELEDND